MRGELWCIHVQGPDTLIPQPNESTARQRAEAWNQSFETLVTQGPYEPRVRCVVEKWPYSFAQHALALEDHGGEPDDIF